MDQQPKPKIRLTRRQDQVFAKIGSDKLKPVKIVWTRPVTGRGSQISIFGMDKKELAMIDSLDELPPASRQIAQEELDRRYLVPRITSVVKTEANFGNLYWEVETNHGPRRFLMKDPAANLIWVTDDSVMLKDTLGNRYEIESFMALDARSHSDSERSFRGDQPGL